MKVALFVSIQGCLESLRATGADLVTLHVAVDRLPAQALYSKVSTACHTRTHARTRTHTRRCPDPRDRHKLLSFPTALGQPAQSCAICLSISMTLQRLRSAFASTARWPDIMGRDGTRTSCSWTSDPSQRARPPPSAPRPSEMCGASTPGRTGPQSRRSAVPPRRRAARSRCGAGRGLRGARVWGAGPLTWVGTRLRRHRIHVRR